MDDSYPPPPHGIPSTTFPASCFDVCLVGLHLLVAMNLNMHYVMNERVIRLRAALRREPDGEMTEAAGRETPEAVISELKDDLDIMMEELDSWINLSGVSGGH